MTQTNLNIYLKEKLNLQTSEEVLENINLDELLKDIILPPTYGKYDTMFFIKFFIYAELKGYSNIKAFYKHLKTSPEKLKILRIKKLPTYSCIVSFKRLRLGYDVWAEIKYRLQDYQHQTRICIRDNVNNHKKTKQYNPLKLLSSKQKKKLVKDIYSFIIALRNNSNTPINAKYKDKDILNAVFFLSAHSQTINAFSESKRFYYDLYERNEIPCNRTILNWVHKIFPTRESVEKFHQFVLERIFAYIRQNMPQILKSPMTVAVDHHLIPTWENLNKSEKQLKGTYHKKRKLTNPTDIIGCAKDRFKSTTNFRKYITLSIVIKGVRFCLGYKPITQLNNIYQRTLVNDLINYAKKFVTIKTILLDRNFDIVSIHSLLQKRGIRYVMPKIIQGNILTEFMTEAEQMTKENQILLKKYTQKSNKKCVNMNVIFIRKKNKNYKKKGYKGKNKDKRYVAHAFCTNMAIESIEAAKEIVKSYKLRWGIETFYKDSKNFFPKTTSNDSSIRDFYFSMSTTIFNLWVLINLVLFVAYLHKELDTPKIRMKTFVTHLTAISYDN